MYHLDVVKTRSQLNTSNSIGVYKTLFKIVEEEGFSRLFRGIISPILAESPKKGSTLNYLN